jgi:hypothetical protein
MALKTGSSSPGEALMMRSTSAMAFCCAIASVSSRVRSSSCFRRRAEEAARLDLDFGFAADTTDRLRPAILPPRVFGDFE